LSNLRGVCWQRETEKRGKKADSRCFVLNENSLKLQTNQKKKKEEKTLSVKA